MTTIQPPGLEATSCPPLWISVLSRSFYRRLSLSLSPSVGDHPGRRLDRPSSSSSIINHQSGLVSNSEPEPSPPPYHLQSPRRSLEYLELGKSFIFAFKKKCAAQSIGLLVQDCSLKLKRRREESSTFHRHRHQQHFFFFFYITPLLNRTHPTCCSSSPSLHFSHLLIRKTKTKEQCPSSTFT